MNMLYIKDLYLDYVGCFILLKWTLCFRIVYKRYSLIFYELCKLNTDGNSPKTNLNSQK